MNLKSVIKFVGWATMFILYVMFVYTFFLAYTGNFEVIVHINDYGEAHWEALWLIVSLPCVFYVVIEKAWNMPFCKKLRKENWEDSEKMVFR